MRTLSQINLVVIVTALVSALAIGETSSRILEASLQTIPPDTLLTLERTVCFGTCPAYKITISADGSVVFEGRGFVKTSGTVKSVISTDQVQELLAMFEKIGYFQLRDRYEARDDGCKQLATDHPSAVTSLRTGGRSKSVRHYYGCRGVEVLADLEKLERAIDDAVNSEQWIR